MGMYFNHQGSSKANRIQSAAYKRNKQYVSNSIDTNQQISQSLNFKNSYNNN